MLYETLSAPITCQIELTTGCDNDCVYCYNHWRHDKHIRGANMKKEVLIETVEQIIRHKVFQVTFTGGEVLLRKDVLFEGVRRVIESDTSCTVNSNLTRLTDLDATTLYRLGLRGILTSLSSHDPVTHDIISQRQGAFVATIAGIKRAQNAGLTVAVSMVVTSLNADHVVSTGLALKDIGVMQFFATKASPPVNALDFKRFMLTKEQFRRVLDDLNILKHDYGMNVGILECYPLCSYGNASLYPFAAGRRCSAGTTTCTIGADGDIRPCSHSETSYGNVMVQGIRNAWRAMSDQRDGSMLPSTCLECAFLENCSGGCRVDAFCCSGKFDSLDPYARPDEVSRIILSEIDIPSVNENEIFHINPRLRVRHEETCVLCADTSMMGTPAPLTHDTYEMLEQFGDRTFNAYDIVANTGLTIVDALRLCGILRKDKIVCPSS